VSLHRRATPVGLTLIGLMYALGVGLVGPVDAAGHLAPLLLVLVPLMGGRYPWEAALVRRRVDPAPARCLAGAAAGCSAPLVVRAFVPRGGSLLAGALAGRSPPLGSCL
jgi:hypothetical protein